jgi:DHA2 family multidrug resistance protein
MASAPTPHPQAKQQESVNGQSADVATPAAPSPLVVAGVMMSCMLGPFINILDINVVNVTLPRIMSGLGADVLTARWVMTAYLIATAVTMPTLGWVGRKLGNQRLYALGVTIFISASALCGAAPSIEVLILVRILQGVGAAVLMPISLALMLEVTPPRQRGLGTSLWAAGASLGNLFGLPIAGFVADAVEWRTVFYLNLVPGSLAVLGVLLLVRPSAREDEVPFDGWGFVTLSAALVSLLVALSQVQQEGWDSTFILSLLAICGVAACLFLFIEGRIAIPLLDLSLYRRLLYTSGTCAAVILGVFFYSSSFLTVLFMQLGLDYSVQQSALALTPGAAAMIICALIAGWLVDRIDPRIPMTIGAAAFGVFCYLMLTADGRVTLGYFTWAYIWRSIGLGFLNAPVFATATSGLETDRARMASSLLSLSLVLGGTFGISLLSTMLERWQTIHQARFAETQTYDAIGTQHALNAFAGVWDRLGSQFMDLYAHGTLAGFVRREALLHAFSDCFALLLYLSIVIGCIVVMMRIVRQS